MLTQVLYCTKDMHTEINNLLHILVMLYADDTVLVSDNAISLQKNLDTFVEYCKIWKLNINRDKTKVVIFGSRNDKQFTFKMENSQLEIVSSYKYLGTIFSKSGSFFNNRKHLAQQAKKALHLLYKRINNLNLPIDLVLKLFENTILPIMTYSCEVWGYENLDILDRIHRDFLRKLFHLKKYTIIHVICRNWATPFTYNY